ncbi:urease accessory protein UreF [Methylotuvimicrobium alcaliphilum]|uniref:Urease accessory protein UreF n=1 Tax=Methylotuvimicrobium alcaliphilum (strain DSM 19304 / NCIMB 14124 / VKM B-2133 / 20Z) TaxID=1091494 RepID=G4T1M8_META2|nr:urease accessory UreF family protein [Methylotuvimicrobium alcaliphilum]CCE23460.1 Urease accessory protein ureF [Methylotuvimicrobium alcaliphilum 20Z]
MITDLALLRLLQLVSPGLPIGMYSYSQGFEGAVEDGLIKNDADAEEWLSGMLVNSLQYIDLPILVRLHTAWQSRDFDNVSRWSQVLKAYRETAELRFEDKQTGQALARLLTDLNIDEARDWRRRPDATLAALFALAAVQWQITMRDALLGYVWSWLENQVVCAVKLVPLGQVAGQRLLGELARMLPAVVDQALLIADDDIGGSAFGLALASSRHEMQYSRLFRS